MSGSVAMVHTTLLLHHCIYSYQPISNLKDAIETPMAQQVCFKPVSSMCLAICCCNLLYVDFSFNWINSYVLMSCTLQVLLLLYSYPHLYFVYCALSWTNIIWTVSLSWFGNINENDIDHTVTILHRYMFVSCCYPVHLTTELVYQNEFHIQHGKPVMCLFVSLLERG